MNTWLTAAPVPLPPVNNYNDANYTDANVVLGKTWVNAPYGDGTVNSRRIASFKAWWLDLMLNQSRSIHEKMVLFWHNHFATQTATIDDSRFIYKHNALLRIHFAGMVLCSERNAKQRFIKRFPESANRTSFGTLRFYQHFGFKCTGWQKTHQ